MGCLLVVCTGRKCSKPLVCISTLLHPCAHVTQPHTHAHIWRSWSTEVSIPHGECLLGLGFAQHRPALCSTHCSSGNVILPNPRTLDEYGTPSSILVSQLYIMYYLPFTVHPQSFACSSPVAGMLFGLSGLLLLLLVQFTPLF